MKKNDLTNLRFGKLKVIKEDFERCGNGDIKWECICDCGNIKSVRASNLKRGKTRSCGCLSKEIKRAGNRKHGLRHHPIYMVWKNMRSRCLHKNNPRYYCYGGRGITICDEWKDDPTSFIKWAEKNGWRQGLQLDRTNNDGNYEPSNCRFVSSSDNILNQGKRRTSNSGYTGVSLDSSTGKYFSEVTNKGRRARLGRYSTKKEALEARNKYIIDNGWSNKLQKYEGE